MVRSDVKLTPRQQRFIEYLLLTMGNGAKAARMAGYSDRSAKEIAHQLLKEPKIRRAVKDYASFVTYLVKHIYRKAKKIVLVEDNLNTHNKETLIAVLGEDEGKRIAQKIEWRFTPKHASWLNQAEIEMHSLEQQCLNRRIPDFHTMQSEVAACVRKRNQEKCGINWQFTREKAREKFKEAL